MGSFGKGRWLGAVCVSSESDVTPVHKEKFKRWTGTIEQTKDTGERQGVLCQGRKSFSSPETNIERGAKLQIRSGFFF